jgi:hypothetical protein
LLQLEPSANAPWTNTTVLGVAEASHIIDNERMIEETMVQSERKNIGIEILR